MALLGRTNQAPKLLYRFQMRNEWTKAIPRPKSEKGFWVVLTALLSTCIVLALAAL